MADTIIRETMRGFNIKVESRLSWQRVQNLEWILRRYRDSTLRHQFPKQLYSVTLTNRGLNPHTHDALCVVDRKPSISSQNGSRIDPTKSSVPVTLVPDIESRSAVHQELYG